MSHSLRARLINVGESFVGFDRAMEAEARRRKQREEEETVELEDEMFRLQKAIGKEVKDRVDDVRNIQFLTQSAANAMLDRLQEDCMKRLTEITDLFEKLNLRVVTLEKGIKQFKGELPSKLLVDTAALVKEVSEARLTLEELDTAWRVRDEQVERRITQIEVDVKRSAEQMLALLDQKMAGVAIECEELCKPQDQSQEEKFREFVLEEFATVKSALMLENESRQRGDEEILEAIQFYSGALQRHIPGN
jgi:hypothetical protein